MRSFNVRVWIEMKFADEARTCRTVNSTAPIVDLALPHMGKFATNSDKRETANEP